MGETMTVLAGVACGLVGCIPPAVLFERALKRGKNAGMSVGVGLASILISFVALSAMIFAVYVRESGATLRFGCALVVTFLAFWGVESLRAWRAANSGSQAGGKDEQ